MLGMLGHAVPAGRTWPRRMGGERERGVWGGGARVVHVCMCVWGGWVGGEWGSTGARGVGTCFRRMGGQGTGVGWGRWRWGICFWATVASASVQRQGPGLWGTRSSQRRTCRRRDGCAAWLGGSPVAVATPVVACSVSRVGPLLHSHTPAAQYTCGSTDHNTTRTGPPARPPCPTNYRNPWLLLVAAVWCYPPPRPPRSQ